MKKLALLLLLVLPGFCLAEQCPSSAAQAAAGNWQSKFVDLHPNFKRFEGAVWRNGNMYCAYQDITNKPRPGVVGKYGYAKPPYQTNPLWQIDPNGIICTKSISKCTFTSK